jgi:hypothetical protein
MYIRQYIKILQVILITSSNVDIILHLNLIHIFDASNVCDATTGKTYMLYYSCESGACR